MKRNLFLSLFITLSSNFLFGEKSNSVYTQFNHYSTCFEYNIIEVTNTNNSGVGSLRWAIEKANTDLEPNHIIFKIPGDGEHLIKITNDLPSLKDECTLIDGFSQTGNRPMSGKVRLDANGAPAGILIEGDNCEVRGMVIFNTGNSPIWIVSDNCIIRENYLFDSRQRGILISGGDNNRILENYIYNTSLQGILIRNNSADNFVSLNKIGIDEQLNFIGEDNAIGLYVSRSTGSYLFGNEIYGFNQGVRVELSEENSLLKNKFYCNNLQGINLVNGNNNLPSPRITQISTSTIFGTSNPSSFINIYAYDNQLCPSSPCQGSNFLGDTKSDNSGNWRFSNPLAENIMVTATATLAGNTSEFSDCAELGSSNNHVESSCTAPQNIIDIYKPQGDLLARFIMDGSGIEIPLSLKEKTLDALLAIYNVDGNQIPERDTVIDCFNIKNPIFPDEKSFLLQYFPNTDWAIQLKNNIFPTSNEEVNKVIRALNLTVSEYEGENWLLVSSDEIINIFNLRELFETISGVASTNNPIIDWRGNSISIKDNANFTELTFSMLDHNTLIGRKFVFRVFPNCTVDFVGSKGDNISQFSCNNSFQCSLNPLCLPWLNQKLNQNYDEYCGGRFCPVVGGVAPFAIVSVNEAGTIIQIHWGECLDETIEYYDCEGTEILPTTSLINPRVIWDCSQSIPNCNKSVNCTLSKEDIFCLPWIRDTLDKHNPAIGNCTIAPDGKQKSYELQRHKNSEGDEVLFIIDQRFADMSTGWYYDCEGNLIGTYFNAGFGGKTYTPAYLESYQYSETIWDCSQSIPDCILPECPEIPEEILCLDWLPEVLEEYASQYCNTTCIGGAGLSLTKFNYLGNNILRLSKSCGDGIFTFYDGAGNVINECLFYSLTKPSDCNQSFLDALTDEVPVWNCDDDIEDCSNNSNTDLTFIIENTDGAPGSTIQVPIKVENFNRVSSFQYTIQIEKSAIAKFKGVADGSLVDITNFSVDDHTINLAWYDLTGLGITLVDGSIIFYLEIEFTGGADECTKIQFKDEPLKIIAFQDLNADGDFEEVIPKTINAGKCCVASSVSKSGTITFENDKPFEGVEVFCNDTEKEITSNVGFYEFVRMPSGLDYIIKPEKKDGTEMGLQSEDAAIIARYIHGNIQLSPYQLIAADVNKDGEINAIDPIIIAQILVGARPAFPNSNPWKFIPKDFKFEKPEKAHTESYEESITLYNLGNNAINQDFIGIKMGDIDLSGTNPLLSAEPRNNEQLELIQRKIIKSESSSIIEIPISTKEVEQLSSFQLELHFDESQLEFIELVSPLSNLTISDKQKNVGIITLTWFDGTGSSKGKIFEKDAVLFHLKFKQLSNTIGTELALGKTFFNSLAFQFNSNRLGVSLEGTLITNTSNSQKNRIKVFHPQPNPFNQATSIKFELPNPQEIILKVIDLSGRVILKKNQLTSSGTNAIEIIRASLPHSGIYFYQLQGSDFVYDGKVILID